MPDKSPNTNILQRSPVSTAGTAETAEKKKEIERELVGSLSGPAKLTEFVTPCKTKAYRYQRLNPDDRINRKLSDQKMKNDQCR